MAVVPGYSPSELELVCITEIVNRLDGLPLAIELAAAQLHTHDVTEIAAALDHRFTLLTAGYRTSPRHGSLRAAVSWSFDQLDADLQRRFTDLSVFAGSFGVDDAAAVCGIDGRAATAALAQLVERSLVMRAPERRFVLLETLRAFGLERLAEDGRGDLAGERHARHQVEWAERADQRLLVPGEPVVAEFDAAIPELRSALGWLLDHGEIELAGRLVTSLRDYGILRLRPDVLTWSDRVLAADPDDRITTAPLVWGVASYASWMAGDLAESGVRSRRAIDVVERRGAELSAEVLTTQGSYELFVGNLAESAAWYGRAADAADRDGDHAQWIFAAGSQLLALGYAGDPAVAALATLLLERVGDAPTPHAAYAWYCAGESDLAIDVERARYRLTRALEIAAATSASFVTGIAGTSKASIDARTGDPLEAAAEYRRLIVHWHRAGMWSTQWTTLRSIAGLLARLGRHEDAAVLEGAVRGTEAGHRIFGADEVALVELGAGLRAALGDERYESARRRGALLDGGAAVEHALRAL
jgi:hypothetical protein